MITSLDGDWLLAVDVENRGMGEGWHNKPQPDAKSVKVPWIIQDAFPGYHGVAWYWREFECPANPYDGGRYLLRFWAVDYAADVWLNGEPLGRHEGGESTFVFDVTGLIKAGTANRLAARVLNPANEAIDDIILGQTPHRNKVMTYGAGASYNHGGITDSVELEMTPRVYVEDLFVRADWASGRIHVQAGVRNMGDAPVEGLIEGTVSPAASGVSLLRSSQPQAWNAGSTTQVNMEFVLDQPHSWDLNDPYLYRVTLRVSGQDQDLHERSVRCGFRDFRFEDGYFRLNGRRIFLRCSHTGNHCPWGLQLPHDPDLLRRDLLNVKAMGFNAIRFIAGVGTRYQLDLCDELGLMVYEESYAGWCLEDSPHMAQRYDESVLGMVKRDRNHPSITMWGLLNETGDGAVFRHAVETLEPLRELDDSRMVMLNSGRWDGMGEPSTKGIAIWHRQSGDDPNVTHNPTDHLISGLGITWQPGQMGMHPGRNGEYSALRWTAPAAGTCTIKAAFSSIAEKATTDVHVLHNNAPLHDGLLNIGESGADSAYDAQVELQQGDTIDFAVGYGNADYGADSTGIAVVITDPSGHAHDAAKDFGADENPNGPWAYGALNPGPKPDAATFAPYAVGETIGDKGGVGTLSNPGSDVWEDVLHDQHCYPRVPHTAAVIRSLREYRGGNHSAGMGEHGYPQGVGSSPDKPVFLSEYGIGSAVDLVRVARHYEQLGATHAEDAQFYRAQLDRFMADWNQWNMAETFGRPEDYFAACLAKMAGQRALGLNAIRANPNFVAFSLTGTVDQGMTGEGLTTTFRELKPGTIDAMFDGFAPLRWCLFAEPIHVYRGTPIRLEAVLANEDALEPGEYTARIQVFGPSQDVVYDKQCVVDITKKGEGPLAMQVLDDTLTTDFAPGAYRFVAAFEQGAAAAGREAIFYVGDAADMPPVDVEVVTWGDDPALVEWLDANSIRHRPFEAAGQQGREVILASGPPPAPGGAQAFATLAQHVARGSMCIFLDPGVFRNGDQPLAWLPLDVKGELKGIGGWLYLKDEWAVDHPFFEGLPTGLLDYTYYRELIPDLVWAGQAPPLEVAAAANKTSQGYDSGLLTAVHALGEGQFVLNTLRIGGNLGKHPTAERLLRNMLNEAAKRTTAPPADLPADFDNRLATWGLK